MAFNTIKVLLGYEDELIGDKYKGLVDFSTNKFGGKPDWPSNITPYYSVCTLCQLPRILVLQIYAPLESTTYHRTLYVFACINPNCWNQNESWCCVRAQTIEQVIQGDASVTSSAVGTTAWCQDADDWDDDNNANVNEENGNVVGERCSDEDDESFSFEESVRAGFENLRVDDRNANTGSLAEAQGGAEGCTHSPTASAEIEGDEGEVVTVDTPTLPQYDITALLQEVVPLPEALCQKQSSLQFVPYFISVAEESTSHVAAADRHVKELLQEYQLSNRDGELGVPGQNDGGGGGGSDVTTEKYEKGTPAHGDKMFHHFLSKIQMNPGHFLRYCRGVTPLILAPLAEVPRKCDHCDGEMVFEFQLLPTLIPRLRLSGDQKQATRIEFGNVLVFTCRQSCWSSADANVRREVVVVQAETC